MASNVPFIGPRKRYSVINVNSSWVIQVMDNGANFDGTLPEILPSGTIADPAVSAGVAKWTALKKGGLFNWFDRRHAIVVEEVYELLGGANITSKILRADGREEDLPNTPFRLGPKDTIKVTSTGATGNPEFGILARIEGSEIL